MSQLINHGVAKIKWPYLGKKFWPKSNATLQHGTRKCRKRAEGAERTWDTHRLWGQTKIANGDAYYLNRHSHSMMWHLVVTKMHGYNKILVIHSNRHLKPHVVIVTEHRYNKILQIRYQEPMKNKQVHLFPFLSGSKLGMHCSLQGSARKSTTNPNMIDPSHTMPKTSKHQEGDQNSEFTHRLRRNTHKASIQSSVRVLSEEKVAPPHRHPSRKCINWDL